MTDKLDNPFQFWHELKRRKVIRVIPVYAAASFVLLELVDIIAEPLRLPDWTINFVLVLLSIGFIISIILSWVYDVTPEGIQKTKSAKEIDEAQKPPTSNIWKVISFVSIVIIVALVLFHIMSSRKQAEVDTELEKSIAVLPFENFSADPDQEWMCNGLTDEIINHLYKIESFDKVVSLNTVLTYKNTDTKTPDIARELKVNYVLEGTYKKIGEQLRVTAQLIEPKNDKHIWQNEYDRPYEEIISIQTDIALQIADHLKAFLKSSEKQNIQKIPTSNQEAYELLQEALYGFYDDSTSFGPQNNQAFDLVLKAIELDPEYADAYAITGNLILSSANYGGGSEMQSAGWDALYYFEKALEIDPDNGFARYGLAQLNDWFIWDYIKAEKEFLKALEILPNDPGFSQQFGEFLIKMNRMNDAKLYFSKLESDFNKQYREIRRKIYSGKNNEAYHSIQEFLKVNGEEGYIWAGEAFIWLEEYDSALFYLEAGKQVEDPEISIPRFQACLALVYNKTEHHEQARTIVRKLNARSDTTSAMSPAFFTGWYYSGIREVDSAFYWLEQAYKNRSPEMPWLKVDPVFNNLKEDDRYWDLYERTGHKAYDEYMESMKK